MKKPIFTAPAKPTLIATAVTSAFMLIFIAVIGAVTLMRQNGEITKYGSPNSNITYDVPLNSVASGNNANLGQLSQIDFSGRLTVNGTLLLPAGDVPKTPTTGELYYDRTTGSVAYYNGSEFKALVTNQQVVSSVGGVQGNIALGQGLQLANNTIVLTNPPATTTTVTTSTPTPTPEVVPTVTSLQGQTGSVVLNPGTGIAITGTTIANGGVTQFAGLTGAILTGKGITLSGNTVSSDVSITSASSDLEVTDDGNGHYSIASVGSGFGGTVALAPLNPQTDNSTNPSIALDKTNTGNLMQLKVNGTDAFVVDNTGTIATGTIAYNQVTGRPTSTVQTLGGASGDIAVGSGLALIGNVLSSTGSGIASVAGTTNQVNVATNSGIATISLPQDIATNSNVSFNTLTLGTVLSIANGGTGATTASQARTNLSAAVSGANGDITSLTNLTAITPIAGLTIGSTTQNLTLQGSTTTLKSTSGSFTTTLNFATPTANNTVTIPNQGGTVCLSTGNCLGGASGGASTSLNNLAGVAINTSLLPGTTTIDLGSSTNPFRDIYLGGTATNNYKLTGSATASRTITLPDQSGTVCLTTGNCAGAGGGITGLGTINTIALFDGTGTITNSILTQDVAATTLTVTGDLNTTGNIYGNGANVTNLSANNVASGTLAIARGGTGTGSTPTNGQILIGNGTGYSLATIQAGSNITVTNTAGGISIGATIPSSGAETSLNNLASVAINASLVPGAGGMALGSATNPYNSLYTGVSGSGVGLSSLATVARTVTFQDAAGTICMQASTACNFATQTSSNYYIQSQIAAVQSASSLWLSGTGRADTSVVTSTIDRQAAANLLVGNTNATAINVGNAASTITLDGSVVAGGSSITIGTVGSTQIVNNGAVINTVKVLGNYATGGVIGTAATTVDVYSAYTVAQTTGGQALSLPAPANTAAGRVVYVSNIGSAAFSISGTTIGSGSSEVYIWNGTTWVPAPAGATTVTTVGATLNPSTFSFAGKVDYGTGTGPNSITASDVNSDGKPDIIAANYSSNNIAVLINNGNGTFAAKVDYASALKPIGITSSDLNGDGKPDIVTANDTSNNISVFINNGNGTFGSCAKHGSSLIA